MITAQELMTGDPVTVSPSTKVREAARILHDLDIRHLPVVDELGALVGMLSDRDLRGFSIPYLIGDEYAGNIETALDSNVATLMNGAVVSVDTEADAAEIVDLMLDNRIGAVPVVDGDGKLVGIVSYVDLLRELPLEAAG